jgi:hypothetical protein
MRERVTMDNRYNLDRTVATIDSTFSLRGIGKAKANDTSRRLLTNYLQIAFDLRSPMDRLKRDAEALKAEAAEAAETAAAPTPKADGKAKDTTANQISAQETAAIAKERAEQAEKRYMEKRASVVAFLDKCVEMMPWDWRARGIHHEFLLDHEMYNEAAAAIERSIAEDPENRVRYEPLLERANAAKGRG